MISDEALNNAASYAREVIREYDAAYRASVGQWTADVDQDELNKLEARATVALTMLYLLNGREWDYE